VCPDRIGAGRVFFFKADCRTKLWPGCPPALPVDPVLFLLAATPVRAPALPLHGL